MDFLTPELAQIVAALPGEQPVYLVGGAVRDRLVGRSVHDLDLALPGDVLPTARRLADRLGAAYYPLDVERDTARLVFIAADAPRVILDIASLRGADLESDLRARDFTINAIAVDLRQPDRLIDPLGGALDLQRKRIRACSPLSFVNDPVRVLRAVRQATSFKFQIVPESLAWMRQAAPQLQQASPERVRDELYRILGGGSPAVALRVLDTLEVLPYVLPELSALKGVQQSPPHTSDVWTHTLDVVSRLEDVLSVLHTAYDPDRAASLLLGLLVLRLGRYREQITAHLAEALNLDRPARATLFLAALYHDVAKPQTQQVEADGRIRFFEHDQIGARLAAARGEKFRLSNPEVERLKKVVGLHMRPLLLGQGEQLPSRKATYRFFRDAGPAGVDVCLLSLADVLATQGAALPQEHWAHHLEVVRILLEAWWEQAAEIVAPPVLVDGYQLMRRFGLQPGRLVGKLLDAIREAQAEGLVHSAEQAFALAQNLLEDTPQE